MWMIVAGILAVAVLAMGWFVGVSPKLDELNDANDQRATVEQQNLVLASKLKELEEQFQKIDELKAELAESQLGLPPGDELSSFLGQLHKLEAASGVKLTKFSASDGQSYVAAPDATGNPAITANNFVAITIDLTVIGSRAQIIEFLSDLQNGDRLFLVTKVNLAQEANKSVTDDEESAPLASYTGSITGYVYVLVDPAAPPPTPTPVGSLDTTETPSPSPSP